MNSDILLELGSDSALSRHWFAQARLYLGVSSWLIEKYTLPRQMPHQSPSEQGCFCGLSDIGQSQNEATKQTHEKGKTRE